VIVFFDLGSTKFADRVALRPSLTVRSTTGLEVTQLVHVGDKKAQHVDTAT